MRVVFSKYKNMPWFRKILQNQTNQLEDSNLDVSSFVFCGLKRVSGFSVVNLLLIFVF